MSPEKTAEAQRHAREVAALRFVTEDEIKHAMLAPKVREFGRQYAYVFMSAFRKARANQEAERCPTTVR